jgi:two-component system, chemotaxis family, protein-glutamate methylesterase/glutaminase
MARENFIVVIGTSAGGSTALPEVLKQLTEEMEIVVFVVMHMTKRTVAEMFVKRLQTFTALKCKLPRQGEQIKPGNVYVAKPDHHLLLEKNKIILGKGPMENRYRPSIDALFRSAAANHDHRVIGIILTGMLEDGAAGMQAIKRSGGVAIIQDPNEAEYSSMPTAAIKSSHPDYVVPVSEMGECIKKTLAKPPKKKKIPGDVKTEAEIAARVQVGIEKLSQLGNHSLFSCPDCGGGLWEIGGNGSKRYRCHVGHAFTEHGLLGSMEVSTESALWTALRILEERKNLLQSLGAKEKKTGNKSIASRYLKRTKELETQMDTIKKVLFRTLDD